MFSLSTTWNATSCDKGGELIYQIKELGFDSVELGFTIAKPILEEIIKLQKDGIIQIRSVHNFCPVPEGYDPLKFTPDFFSVSSTDTAERQKAVDLTLNSLYTASEVKAKALIIHAGRVDMKQRTKELARLFNQGLKGTAAYDKLKQQIIQERQSKKAPHIDALMRSLDVLVPKSEQLNIKLCLENRYYYREIPSQDEFGYIFKKFQGTDNLLYWHDVGHAQVAENLGFYQHSEYLKQYAEKICGIHLHDITGTIDHKAPGCGNFNFEILRPYLRKDLIKVLEIHKPATKQQIKQGVLILKKLFGEK